MIEVVEKREPSPVFPFLCIYGKHTGLMLKNASDNNFLVLSSTDEKMKPLPHWTMYICIMYLASVAVLVLHLHRIDSWMSQ